MFQFQYTKRAGDRRSTDMLCAQTFSFDLYQLLNKIKEKRKENVCCVRKQYYLCIVKKKLEEQRNIVL